MSLYPKILHELDAMPEPAKTELLSSFSASPEMRQVKRRLLIEDLVFIAIYLGLLFVLKYPYSVFVHLLGFATCLFAFHRGLSKNIQTINLLFLQTGQPNRAMHQAPPKI